MKRNGQEEIESFVVPASRLFPASLGIKVNQASVEVTLPRTLPASPSSQGLPYQSREIRTEDGKSVTLTLYVQGATGRDPKITMSNVFVHGDDGTNSRKGCIFAEATAGSSPSDSEVMLKPISGHHESGTTDGESSTVNQAR